VAGIGNSGEHVRAGGGGGLPTRALLSRLSGEANEMEQGKVDAVLQV
jgi:hypothetical protein